MLGQSEQLSLLPMYVLDVAHILFGQVHSVLPSEKLNSVYFTGLWQVHFFTHYSPSVIVSFFWFSLYWCKARLFVLSDTQLQLLCSNSYKLNYVISIHL